MILAASKEWALGDSDFGDKKSQCRLLKLLILMTITIICIYSAAIGSELVVGGVAGSLLGSIGRELLGAVLFLFLARSKIAGVARNILSGVEHGSTV